MNLSIAIIGIGFTFVLWMILQIRKEAKELGINKKR